MPGKFRLVPNDLSFTLLHHNMALLVSPAPYLGRDRKGAIEELIRRLRVKNADVVGLCEVFDNDERRKIREKLSSIYPVTRDGPDTDDLVDPVSDGGLLLLSKFPILENQSHQLIYADCAGYDCLAHKGILHIRIQPTGSILHWDIFYTHTQNLETHNGRQALNSQLNELGGFIRKYRDPGNPAIIMGDLNVYYTHTELPWDYDYLVEVIGNTVDLWKVKYDERT